MASDGLESSSAMSHGQMFVIDIGPPSYDIVMHEDFELPTYDSLCNEYQLKNETRDGSIHHM